MIDVFMNVLGVLMITAVVLALAAQDENTSRRKQEKPSTPPPATQTKPKVAPARLSLPQAQEVDTRPIYLFINAEGIRAFSGDDMATTGQYFAITDLGMQTLLQPVAGQVMTAGKLRRWLRQNDPSLRHVIAAITPEGSGFYLEARRIASEEGFRSGWVAHEGNSVVLGPGGRSESLVQ
ncbi:hypothetical protein [Cyanobium sp. NIES-981]|uniref:hypothetical protein n=1 Tax=Cyanobium sp. NIES-981 TaxID=1851505 RepID=UPI0012FC39C6|nr:hypothetical protein [Cyanobium sp. NIES-981]